MTAPDPQGHEPEKETREMALLHRYWNDCVALATLLGLDIESTFILGYAETLRWHWEESGYV